MTLDALAAATADAHEVDDAIRIGGNMAIAEAHMELGDDELEAELAALAEEGGREKEIEDLKRTEREHAEWERQQSSDSAEPQKVNRRAPGETRTPVLETA